METGHSDTITEGIRVRVAAEFRPELSAPRAGRFVFAYRAVISNEGTEPAKLLTRHWIIRDADGERTDVRGPGVVGEQPSLSPGDSFEYVSSCPLETSWGTMEGTYGMLRPNGQAFDAVIGRFFLAETVTPLSQRDG